MASQKYNKLHSVNVQHINVYADIEIFNTHILPEENLLNKIIIVVVVKPHVGGWLCTKI